MGFSFNFFGNSEHRVFNYKPRYYDPDKEERRRIFGNVDGRKEDDRDEEGNRKPGSYIRGSLREGNYQHTRLASGSKVQKILGMAGLLLFFVVLYFIARFYGFILG